MSYRILVLTAALSAAVFACKTKKEAGLCNKVAVAIKNESIRRFNGSILVYKNGLELCEIIQGKANEAGERITKESQFVIGSLSKQITAVLILQAEERGELSLNDRVSTYLPEIKQSWADSVTVYHLLNHTHGIVSLEQGLSFDVGAKFAYSNLGYDILGKILEKASGKSYGELSSKLFAFCGMKNSTDPRISDKSELLSAMLRNEEGEIKWMRSNFEHAYVPAASILSTAADLALWNKNLHGGKLISKENYKRMTSASATQNHALFGEVGYGFGLRISNENGLLEFGHTGYDTGFVSMNFYYPESETTAIVIENLDWNADHIKDTFCHELAIRELVRKMILSEDVK